MEDITEVLLLKILLIRENYNRYSPFIKKHVLSDWGGTLFKDFGEYLAENESIDEIDLSKFRRWFKLIKHPIIKPEKLQLYEEAITNIEKLDSDEIEVELDKIIKEFTKRDFFSQIAEKAMQIAEGDSTVTSEEVKQLVSDYEAAVDQVDATEKLEVKTDIVSLINAQSVQEGLDWRLDELNISVGPVKHQLIIFGARPDCYSDDTEILSDNGWVLFKDLPRNSRVATYTDTGNIEFKYPSDYIEQDYSGDMIHFTDKLGRVDLLVSPTHDIVVEQQGKGAHKVKATQAPKSWYKYLPTAGRAMPDHMVEHSLDPIDRLRVAYQADGSAERAGCDGSKCGHKTVRFGFSKERKKERLRDILNRLDDCGISYKETKHSSRKNYTVFYVKVPIHMSLEKNFDWVQLDLMTVDWARDFIEELSHWDATRRTETRFKFDTVDKLVADKVQAIALLGEINCNHSVFSDKRSDKFKDVHSLSLRTNYKPSSYGSINTTEVAYSGKIYCVTVPSGMLVVRRNNAACVSGNSGKTLFLTSELSYMAEQLKNTDKEIIVLNNEEDGDVVKHKIVQSALGRTNLDLKADPVKALADLKAKWGRSDRVRVFDNIYNVWQAQQILERNNPGVIVIDQLWNMRSHISRVDSEVTRITLLYKEARKWGKTYKCPVLVVHQLDGSAGGVMYPNMEQFYLSKTALQGDGDVIITLGKSYDPSIDPMRRGLHIVKNKLGKGPKCVKEYKHGQMEIEIQPEIGRLKGFV